MVMSDRYPVRPSGPLAGWVHPFRAELIGQGFTPRTAQDNAYRSGTSSEGSGPGITDRPR